MPGLIDTDLGLCEIDNGLIWLEGGLGGAGLSPEPLPPGTMITEAGIIMITEVSGATMITETDLTPSWVLSVGGFGADLDIDFVGDQAWDGATVAISDLLTCVRASPALTYAQTSAGTLTSFAANTLRYTDLGLLVEESRINYCLYSQTISNGAWSNTGLTIADDQIAAPDGTTTADKLTVTASPAFSSQPVTIASAAAAAWSFYIKRGTANFAWADPFDGSNHRTYFDLVNGTVGTNAAGNTSTITALANGWYRIVIQRTSADVSTYANIGLADADNDLNVTVGKTAYVWGSQIEQGAFPTSYIPTTSASVTRDADAITFDSAAFWDQADGTLYAQQLGGQRSAVGTICGYSAGTNIIRMGEVLGGVGMDAFNGGSQTVAISGSSGITADTTFLLAGAYAHNDFALYRDGAQIGTDTSSAVPPVDTVEVGGNGVGFRANAYILRFAYWDVRLSNANLVTLTS